MWGSIPALVEEGAGERDGFYMENEGLAKVESPSVFRIVIKKKVTNLLERKNKVLCIVACNNLFIRGRERGG